MYKITPALLFLFFGISFGQHIGPGECNLQPDNKAWIWDFKEANTKESKIELITNKIINYTDYFYENPPLENLDDRSTFGEIPCTPKCAIRFVLIYGKNKGLVLNLHKNPELEDLVNEFNADNIDKIELNEHNKRDIYGHASRKRSGVVLHTDNKFLKKQIKRALKTMAKS